jgi:hypothetical protein
VNTSEGDGQFVVGTTCRRGSQSERKVTDGTSHRVTVSSSAKQLLQRRFRGSLVFDFAVVLREADLMPDDEGEYWEKPQK